MMTGFINLSVRASSTLLNFVSKLQRGESVDTIDLDRLELILHLLAIL